MRLYLPGTECAQVVVGYQQPIPTTTLPPVIDPDTGLPVDTVPPVVEPPADGVDLNAPIPILEPVTTATTIAPEVLDPYTPLPSVPLDAYVEACAPTEGP